MKNTRKIISVLLSILMIITSVPLMAVESFAADVVKSGTTGECTWTLDSDGVLTISGNGKMKDYYTPWGESITKVIIENGVTSIGYETFYECTSLTSVTIPNSVTSIGYDAFRNCTSLTSITIPDSVTSIDNSAFYNCTSLTSINIPDGVTSIGEWAFGGCTSLVEINVGSENAKFSSENGVLFNKDKTKLITYPSGKKDEFYVIPDGVTSIDNSAFYNCTSLTSINIPDGVTSIGNGAFSGCTSLTDITIPDSVTSIGEWAFGSCTSLAIITIPDGVTSIGNGAFDFCTSLTSVTIGNGVKSIGNSAFSRCTSLTSVTIGNGVKSIGNSAFSGCTSLTSITIPDSVTSIDDYAFNGSAYYRKDSNWDNGILYIGNHLIKAKENVSGNVEIRQGTRTIAERAFSGCTSLTSVTIGNGVKSIGNSAFSGCTSLTSITIPDSVTSIGGGAFDGSAYYSKDSNWDNGILYIGNHLIKAKENVSGNVEIRQGTKTIAVGAFSGCTSLTSVTIGNGVKSIGSGAFSGCTSLTSVTIGNGVKSIGSGAFSGCTSLTSVTIPDSVTSIDNSAFYNCTSLTSINIPDSVTSIGNYAFDDCKSLKSVNIPDSVTTIAQSAFRDCSSLTSVTIGNGVTSISDSAFDGCYSLVEINVGSENANFSSENGVLFNKDKTKLITYPSGKKDEFYVIPDGVTSIDNSAFYDCTSLTDITIPDSVTSIGEAAFESCKSLKRVYIPDTVTTIGETAFGYYWIGEKIDGFTIIGKPGSAAQAYAEKNGFAFVYPESIKVSKLPDKATYFIGDAFDPTGIVVSYVNNDGSEDAINAEFTITGFDSSVAGKNTITVAYDGKTATFDVEIKAPSIALSESSLAFDCAGATKTLTATTVPSDSEIVWKSSNENVATVENGVVTAKGAGTATITAKFTYNNIEYTATCNVTVAVPTVPPVTFPDVRSGDWYYDAVKFNFERGYITGYSNGTFGPANNIQRQDFVLILARIAGADLSAYEGQNGGFSDVQTGSYYASAVAWAKDTGVANGFSADNFGVGTFISREQICIMLCRYLNGSVLGNADTILNAYPDGGNTSPWAKESVAWAVENGIVGNAGYINPIGNAGRAEVAQIIYNMANKGMI